MNQAFLPLYSQLINSPSTQAAKGLWLAHGDEPLLTQWLIDALRPIWHSQGQNVNRIELKSIKTWQEVLTELNSLSLFDPANTIIVTGNHKPDKKTQEQLIEFANICAQEQSDNHLLWITPKQDKRALSAKWAQAFNKQGMVIDCNLYNERQRMDILQGHANQFGLTLNQEAWQLLMSHTQNHLLNAYQTLWRLSYLFAPQSNAISSESDTKDKTQINYMHIDAQQLQDALVSESSFSTFDLSDAMLSGNSQQVAKIIEGLKTTGEPTTLVLWVIAQDVRRIQLLLGGKDPQSLGIWQSKQGLYRSAISRHNIQDVNAWTSQILKCDQAIKGFIQQSDWELLLDLALKISGFKAFTSHT